MPFANLAAGWQSTAAGQGVPLVMWFDVVRGELARTGYRHLDFFSLYVVQRGRGTHVIEGAPFGVARGDVYAMGPGMAHYFSGCEDLVLETLHFAPQIFDAAARRALANTPGLPRLFVGAATSSRNDGTAGRWLHLTPSAYANVAAQLAELRTEWASGTPSGTLLTRPLFLRLLVYLARQNEALSAGGGGRPEPEARPASAAQAGREATVAAAVRYLDTHFAGPVRIEAVAASVFLSPDRFAKVFAQVMGRPPRDYLRHLRVERAKTLLSETDLPVGTIAREAGFGEAAYFTRMFRAATGTTPLRFRQTRAGRAPGKDKE